MSKPCRREPVVKVETPDALAAYQAATTAMYQELRAKCPRQRELNRLQELRDSLLESLGHRDRRQAAVHEWQLNDAFREWLGQQYLPSGRPR
jgi:hypothetical protein